MVAGDGLLHVCYISEEGHWGLLLFMCSMPGEYHWGHSSSCVMYMRIITRAAPLHVVFQRKVARGCSSSFVLSAMMACEKDCWDCSTSCVLSLGRVFETAPLPACSLWFAVIFLSSVWLHRPELFSGFVFCFVLPSIATKTATFGGYCEDEVLCFGLFLAMFSWFLSCSFVRLEFPHYHILTWFHLIIIDSHRHFSYLSLVYLRVGFLLHPCQIICFVTLYLLPQLLVLSCSSCKLLIVQVYSTKPSLLLFGSHTTSSEQNKDLITLKLLSTPTAVCKEELRKTKNSCK